MSTRMYTARMRRSGALALLGSFVILVGGDCWETA
jgi:hypothetical protein